MRETLQRLLEAYKTLGFVDSFLRMPNFNDEPQFYHYAAVLKKSRYYRSFNSSGCSLEENKAKVKTLAESVERYCQYRYRPKNVIVSPYHKLSCRAVDPTSIARFSKNQYRQRALHSFHLSPNDVFRWVKGVSLLDGRTTMVPLQLVSMVNLSGKEKMLRFPVTYGTACGSSMAEAACRAIWECIERDAFLITYLNKLPRAKIIIDEPEIVDIIDYFARYKLEVHCFDITSDIPIPTVMVMIIDRTGVGPVVIVTAKCHMNAKHALIGALEETAQFRSFIRKELLTRKRNINKTDLRNFDHEGRVMYWQKAWMLKYLDFLLHSKNTISLSAMSSIETTYSDYLNATREILKERDIETILVDCTTEAVKPFGLWVVRAVMPKLQPFYVNEAYKYWGGQRFYTVPRILGYTATDTTERGLYTIPHPL